VWTQPKAISEAANLTASKANVEAAIAVSGIAVGIGGSPRGAVKTAVAADVAAIKADVNTGISQTRQLYLQEVTALNTEAFNAVSKTLQREEAVLQQIVKGT
jgi:hypothetical protein